MVRLQLRNLNENKKLIDVFILDDFQFFSTSEGKQINIDDVFHMAVRFGSNQIFRHALKMGARPKIKDCDGNSAFDNLFSGLRPLELNRCPKAEFLEIFKILINKCGCPLGDEAARMLHQAVEEGLQDIAEFLIHDLKVNVDTKAGNGETPLFVAIKNEYVSIARMLLQNGANPNALSNSGITPLWKAASCKYPRGAMFDLLIEFGANPTICHRGTKLVSFLCSQGDWNGHISLIERLKLDPAYVQEAREEHYAREAAARKKRKEAQDAWKKAEEAAAAARKQAQEAAAAAGKEAQEAASVARKQDQGAEPAVRKEAQVAPDVPKQYETRVLRNKSNSVYVTTLKKIYNFMKRPSLALGVVGATIVAVFGTMSPFWVFVGTAFVAEGGNWIRERLAKRAYNHIPFQPSYSCNYSRYFREGVRAQNNNWEYAKSFIISPKTYFIGTEAATAFQAGREAARLETERRSRYSR